MAVKKKKKKTDTWRTKQAYSVLSPKFFEEKEVATTIANDDKKVIGRIVKVPLRSITGTMSHQFIKLSLRINEIKGTTAHTEAEGFEMAQEYLRRNIRRRRSLVKLVLNGKTKDKRGIRVTAYAFTVRKVDTSKKKAIREVMRKILEKEIKKNNFESFFQKSIFGNIASEMFKEAKQIAPIIRIEISKCKTIRGK